VLCQDSNVTAECAHSDESAIGNPDCDLLIALLIVWMLHDDCLYRLGGLLWLWGGECRVALGNLCDAVAQGTPARQLGTINYCPMLTLIGQLQLQHREWHLA
jgi:hypothetical protein